MKPSTWKYFLILLSLISALALLTAVSTPDNNLHLIACDVGQGDATLITQGNTQILIDGGPGNKVIDCLSSHLPFWDRTIELVVLSHPQSDHYQGLIEVFSTYHVNTFLTTNLENSAQSYQVLKNKVGESHVEVIYPTSDTTLKLGKISLDIVWPSEEHLTLNTQPNQDLNNFSIVALLSFGEFDTLLTGDIGPEIIPDILNTDQLSSIEYLKVPHHGSKNGLTQELLDATSPQLATISVGRNSYGHPHQEIIDMLLKAGVITLRTDQMGDIEIITNGSSFWLAN
jgi:competence protein ComEC